jgi:prephenate dehydrogenase
VSELDALLQRGDTLVVAAPLDATLTILERCSGAPPKAALIVDVASVKAPLLPFVARLAGFVPTHPLAGAEQSGPAASRDDLFIGRPWAYVPSGDPLLEGRVLQFIRAMGAEPFAVEAERHDRIVALTSHVPQMLSTVLGATLGAREEPLLSELHGPGLESMVRLARSAWPMWRPVVKANAPLIAEGLRRIAEAIDAVAANVEADDDGALEAWFEQANRFVKRLDAGRSDLRR